MVISARIRLFFSFARPALWASALMSLSFQLASLYVKASELNARDGGSVVRQLSADENLNHSIEIDQPMLARFADDSHLRRSPMNYRETLRGGPSLVFLFSEPSGVSEGYSIGEHTARVLNLYFAQSAYYPLAQISKPADVRNWDRLLTYTLAFHDIGKSIAYRGGDKSRETVYSVPLASDLLPAAGLNAAETKIGLELIGAHQLIGEFLQGVQSLNETQDEILEHAKASGLRPQQFFALLEVVFVADAGSYPHLHASIFKTINGRLIPSEAEYQDLARLFR